MHIGDWDRNYGAPTGQELLSHHVQIHNNKDPL